MTGAVLGTAAYYGDKALFDRFLVEYKKTKDRQERQRIQGPWVPSAIPASIQAGMEAMLSGEVPSVRRRRMLLFAGQRRASTAEDRVRILKGSLRQIVAKRPVEEVSISLQFYRMCGANYATPNEKRNWTPTSSRASTSSPEGREYCAQVLERIDLCIAGKQPNPPALPLF